MAYVKRGHDLQKTCEMALKYQHSHSLYFFRHSQLRLYCDLQILCSPPPAGAKGFPYWRRATTCENPSGLGTLPGQWSWMIVPMCSHVKNTSHVWLFITQSQGNRNWVSWADYLIAMLHSNSYHRLIKSTKMYNLQLKFSKGRERRSPKFPEYLLKCRSYAGRPLLMLPL